MRFDLYSKLNILNNIPTRYSHSGGYTDLAPFLPNLLGFSAIPIKHTIFKILFIIERTGQIRGSASIQFMTPANGYHPP
jgi:hypothetical protein